MVSFSKIEILDTTLREGEQTPGISFTIDQKIAIDRNCDNNDQKIAAFGEKRLATCDL